jgi:hypothetical protein
MPGIGIVFHPRTWLRWVPAALLLLVLVRLVWLAWTASARGVDFTDEGIYLVSYRYYRSPQMVYNGAAAFFGPLFQLVGYSVVWLRRIKIVLVLACGLGLGWATATFARARPDGTSRLQMLPVHLAITLFVGVGGFTMYTWLPQSPGYNDLSVLCAAALAAMVLPAVTSKTRARMWWLVAAGAIVAVSLINKWPAGVCMVAVVVAALMLARGWRNAGRDLRWVAAGLLLGWVLLAVISGHFFQRLSELRSSSEQLSDSLPIWDSYLLPYWRNLLDVARLVGARVWLILAVGVALSLVAASRRSIAFGGGLALAVLLAIQSAAHSGQFRGGDFNVGLSQVALPLLFTLAGVVWLIGRVAAALPAKDSAAVTSDSGTAAEGVSTARTRGAALILLIGLGGAQAFGTLNPPMFVVVSSGALCAAAIVIVAADAMVTWRPAILPMTAVLIVLPLATQRMMLSGLWQHPYRLATNLYAQTEPLDAVIGYDGLSTDSDTARLLHDLSEIARRRSLVGLPGLSVSSSPGLTFALGLTHPPADLFISSVEYVPDNADIYSARVRTACARGLISPDNPPVILTASGSAPSDTSLLLAECGIIFPDDFELEVAGSVGVWIPVQS